MAIKFNDGIFGNETITFEIIVCFKCKVPFMVTSDHRARLIQTHEGFFCPAGHQQHYTKNECEIEKEKLLKDLENQKRWNEQIREKRNELWDEIYELKRQNRELRSTACPTCGKKVIDIKKHIKKYHSK